MERGIAQSRTTPYNPLENSQCERYNGIIRETVQLDVKSRNVGIHHWEEVLPDALHSIRSLISTATDATPHERLLQHSRKSVSGSTLPAWLLGPCKVLYKPQVRHTKEDPLVDEVDLIGANAQYAHVRFDGGRESTVSTKHLAPATDVLEPPTQEPGSPAPTQPSPTLATEPEPSCKGSREMIVEQKPPPRRSTRYSKPPECLIYTIF